MSVYLDAKLGETGQTCYVAARNISGQLYDWTETQYETPADDDITPYLSATTETNETGYYAATVTLPNGTHYIEHYWLTGGEYVLYAENNDPLIVSGAVEVDRMAGITSLADWLGVLAGLASDATPLAEINATTGGATYDNTTDSLEALKAAIIANKNITTEVTSVVTESS